MAAGGGDGRNTRPYSPPNHLLQLRQTPGGHGRQEPSAGVVSHVHTLSPDPTISVLFIIVETLFRSLGLVTFLRFLKSL